MATETLSVFKNIANQIGSTTAITTANVVTNTATEQAVIIDIEVSATDAVYGNTITVTQDGIPLKKDGVVISSNTSTAGQITSLNLSGKQLVDKSSVFDIVLTSSADMYYAGKTDGMIFDVTNGIFKVVDGNIDSRLSTTAYSETVLKAGILSTNLSLVATPASSAFGWMSGINKRFSRCMASTVYTHNDTGTLIQTAAVFSYLTVHGACTDGTYFYGKADASNAILERRLVSTGLAATSITLSIAIPGQTGNQGGYTFYYNGFIYIKSIATATAVYKINATTGLVSTIAVATGSSYSAGACITVAADGVPYIVEYATVGARVLNLNTEQETVFGSDVLVLSTEYGNYAIEYGVGVCAFVYNATMTFIDVNNMTQSASATTASANLPAALNSNGIASSMCGIPLHEQTTTVVPRAITYDVFASGVKITGV